MYLTLAFLISTKVYICMCQTTEEQEVQNIALGKPAYQISTSHSGYAGKAVDGNSDGNYGHGEALF